MRVLTGLFTAIGIILVLSCLASLGHDIYYAYEKNQSLSLSQIGYYIQAYLPEYYDTIRDSIGSEDYTTLSEYFYDMHTAYFTGILSVIFLSLAFIFDKLSGDEASSVSYTDKSSFFARKNRTEVKKTLYKRK